MPRSIVHLDADAFFASVEQAADPRLRGKAVAVGGEKRGIIASASYEARRHGVYTPMPTVRARRLCPQLIVVPGDFEKYERFSQWMFSYAYDFTPDVEITSIDEGYFDLSGVRRPAVDIADLIRKTIGQSLKLSVSEGIGSNKLISQIASKLHKPAGFAEIHAGQETDFLHPLKNQWLPGVGPTTASRLNAAGLALIGQVADTPLDWLELLLGKQAFSLRQFARGIDERPVVPAREPAKSYGQQETFGTDLTDEDYAEAVLRRMADELMRKIRGEGKAIRTLTVKVRYNDMAEDQCGESLQEPTDLETDLYGRIRLLLRQAWRRRVSLRMVSLKLSNVYNGSSGIELPIETSAQRQGARRRLADAIDALRQERGPLIVLRGHDFRLRAGPVEAMPSAGTALVLQDSPGPLPGIPPVNAKPNPIPTPTGPPPSPPPVPPSSQAQSQPPSQSPEPHHQQTPALSPARGTAVPPASATTPASGPGSGSGTRYPASKLRGVRPLVVRRGPAVIPWVPLRVHSHYSFLDSTLSPEAIVRMAAARDCPAVAMTDTANIHGAVEFILAARQAGVKPLLGAEVRVGDHPLLLYVESARGYANLCRILSRDLRGGTGYSPPSPAATGQRPLQRQGAADTTGKNPRSRTGTAGDEEGVDFELSVAARQRQGWNPRDLEGLTEGLVAVGWDDRLAHLFPGRFYRGLDGPNPGAGTRGHPELACPSIHYGDPGDRLKFDVVQSIRTRTLLRQLHPEKRLQGDYHFRTATGMRLMWKENLPALQRQIELMDRCQFEFPFGKPQFPAYRTADGLPAGEFLRQRVFAGLRERYPRRHHTLEAQVREELGIISEVGYEEYFLVVWDILQECRRRGIDWITRGSAADSLVCYCLRISDVCPIRFDLYFRRFLNKDRMKLNKLPDIDVDFPHDRKDDVIDLIFAKYGQGHAAVVGGFSTYQARGAVGDVAKVLGVSEYQIRRFTEHFPWSGSTNLAEHLRNNIECRDLPLDEEPYKTAIDMAAFLDGVPRNPKMHPCGVVLSRQPMSELTPTFRSNKGYPATQFDMDAVEAIGLVKIDILAQGGLSVLRDVRQLLQQRGVHIDLDRCVVTAPPDMKTGPDPEGDPLEPWIDPKVWSMIAGGGARAVHHIESPAMISLCRMCQVREIDGLVAIVSVIRPGAANEQKKLKFTRRYQGLEPVEYPHPSLEPSLRSTYGLVVYEEHILQICEAFAGLSPGRADVLRRALAKHQQTVIDTIHAEFVASAIAKGHAPSVIGEIWDLISGFAGYAFCKAHSTAYGVEAYQSAWLKCHFPVEFMAACLTQGKGFYNPLVYILECHRLGIPLLPPSIQHPGPAFGVEPGPPNPNGQPRPAIRIPLHQIKGLTERTLDLACHESARGAFLSMADFYRRVGPSAEEMELLIRVGAFDGFGRTRTDQFWEAQFLKRSFGPVAGTSQGWLLPPPELDHPPAMTLKEPTRHERLAWETEALGYTASGHPLELYERIAWDTYCPVSRLGNHIGQRIMTCGLIIEQRVHHQVTGEPMKFLTLADWTGMVETELFAATYRNHGLATIRYPVLEVEATVEPYENGRGFSLRVHRAGKPREKRTP